MAAGEMRVASGACARGFFVHPTVFDGCADTMTIVQEEIFGSVMAIVDFAYENDVVTRQNAAPYGLAAGLFTRDLTRAHPVAARLDAGVVWINHYNVTPVAMPFRWQKAIGSGSARTAKRDRPLS
jgi:betaine-aldehyde dehydrogenase